MKNTYFGLLIAAVTVCLVVAYYMAGTSGAEAFDGGLGYRWLGGALGMLAAMLTLGVAVRYLRQRASIRAFLSRDGQRPPNAKAEDDESLSSGFGSYANGVSQHMRRRYGRRWTARHSWLVVCGDEAMVDHVAPELRANGFAIVGQSLLLYGGAVLGEDLSADMRRVQATVRLRASGNFDAFVLLLPDPASARAVTIDDLPPWLASTCHVLRWAAPVYVIESLAVHRPTDAQVSPAGCLWNAVPPCAESVAASLGWLARELADSAVSRSGTDEDAYCDLGLSKRISAHADATAARMMELMADASFTLAWRGLFFYAASTRPSNAPPAMAEAWCNIGEHSRYHRGHRVGASWSRRAAFGLLALALITIATTLGSFTTQQRDWQQARTAFDASSTHGNATTALLALDQLQKHLDTLASRTTGSTPWLARLGLNRDADLHEALWQRYLIASRRLLVDPLRHALEARLAPLATIADETLAASGEEAVKTAYDNLRSYLSLAYPSRADGAVLLPALLALNEPSRPASTTLSEGEWFDLRQRVLRFHVTHLAHTMPTPALAWSPRPALVASARQTLIGVMGLQNSVDSVYDQLMAQSAPKYPPLSLSALLGEHGSRGLFGSPERLPGVFTRAAWEERIGKAIDDAGKSRAASGDWVLLDDASQSPAALAPDALRTALRQRYFADFARAWQTFLNSVRWQPETTLSGTVDQLNLLADPQRPPLSALFRVIVFQAGTGAALPSLSDALVDRARGWVKRAPKDPSAPGAAVIEAPLAEAFGPLLRLADNDDAAASDTTTDRGLGRFMERVTSVRLKLQQIAQSDDPQGRSRAAAQAVLQGRSSDIADSREFASRMAAGLGQHWSAFGDAVLLRPLEQTWQVLLAPAAASFNDTWRNTIVHDWQAAFAARYPFVVSDNDASLPELSRFIHARNGLLAQFIGEQLGGVIERQGDRWLPVPGSDRGGLRVDPAFLAGMNELLQVANVLFASGDARIRYELRGIPSPGVTAMTLTLDGGKLRYFNQREAWQSFLWPGDALENRAFLTWQTATTGLRASLDETGRFALIRLLEKATITPQDTARSLLTWPAPQDSGQTVQLVLRSESGGGPLDVLKLRGFELPTQIFINSDKPRANKDVAP